MKNELIKYLEYEKSNLSPEASDFSRILNAIEVKSAQVPSPTRFAPMRSPIFAWSFGFSGIVAALFMFIISDITNTPSNNLNPQGAAILSYNENTSASMKKSAVSEPAINNKDKAINTIDSISSFSNIDTE